MAISVEKRGESKRTKKAFEVPATIGGAIGLGKPPLVIEVPALTGQQMMEKLGQTENEADPDIMSGPVLGSMAMGLWN